MGIVSIRTNKSHTGNFHAALSQIIALAYPSINIAAERVLATILAGATDPVGEDVRIKSQ